LTHRRQAISIPPLDARLPHQTMPRLASAADRNDVSPDRRLVLAHRQEDSTMQQHFEMLAGYNSWANSRLYDAAASLSDSEYRADKGAFFKSIHGTLNHLLVADQIWMRRFTKTGEAADRLDAILSEDLPGLRRTREIEDKRIVEYIGALNHTDLDGFVSYRRVSSPEEIVQKLAHALAHFFNHQTHHRGQAHAILTALVGKAPELDLLFFQRSVAV
jgi:uncharacterized damage-inducible protein DinB